MPSPRASADHHAHADRDPAVRIWTGLSQTTTTRCPEMTAVRDPIATSVPRTTTTSRTVDAIVVTDLAKRYESGVQAVRGVSFRVGAGEIVGLLGPNGAGKSTTLNVIAALVTPTSGDVRIFGRSVADRAAVSPMLGVALQATGIDPMMSVHRHFEIQAALYRLSARKARVRAVELIDAFDLAAATDRAAGELSGGTQRRLSLALALLHEPRAIVLDEPTAGLDPNAKRVVWGILEDLRDQGTAILFSTHYMDEADHLCDRIEVIADGRIVASGAPAELKAEVTTGVLRLRIHEPSAQVAEVLTLATSRGLLPADRDFQIDADVVQVHADLLEPSFIPLLTLLLQEIGADVLDVSWGHGTLDDVFVHLWEPSAGDDAPLTVTMEHRVHARRGRRR